MSKPKFQIKPKIQMTKKRVWYLGIWISIDIWILAFGLNVYTGDKAGKIKNKIGE